MTNSVRPDQTAPRSNLFASILKFVSNVRQLFAADDFSRRHFQMHFFLGALRVNNGNMLVKEFGHSQERMKRNVV